MIGKVTESVSAYVKRIGADIKKMSEATGIPYMSLYDSLRNTQRSRQLKADELLLICDYLAVSPWTFYTPGISIDGRRYEEICIKQDDGTLIASITAEDIIEAEGVTVVCVPFNG